MLRVARRGLAFDFGFVRLVAISLFSLLGLFMCLGNRQNASNVRKEDQLLRSWA